MLLGVDL
jgi:hypothetical protein